MKGQDARPQAPLYAYAAVSLSNVVSTSAQYEALRYLTFPLQTLAKCAKMVPVMLWGAAINRKTYSLQVGHLALCTSCLKPRSLQKLLHSSVFKAFVSAARRCLQP